MPSQSVENYLEALYDLSMEGEPIRTTKIASSLGLSPASVTEMVQRLASEGYLDYKRYHGVRLTPKGIAMATDVLRRRRLLEVFLLNVLGLDLDLAREEAHRIEHAISTEVEDRLCALLGNPQNSASEDEDDIPLCPRAPDDCPDCQRRAMVPLTALASGHRGVVRAILEDDRGSVALSRLGLDVGSEFQVLKSSGKSVMVSVKGERARVGWDIAQRIVVKQKD
jgi:DtxR family Mn-dependent transcriptional regulator